MTMRKIAVIAGAVLLTGGWGAGAFAQAQPQHQSVPRGYGVAGAPSRQEHRPLPGSSGHRPLPPRPDDRSGPYRPPVAGAPHALPRYRQPAVIVSILIGSTLPYGYDDYPIDNWAYYNLPAPCCGQYWVQYGQSFLLVNPDGVVLQVFTP